MCAERVWQTQPREAGIVIPFDALNVEFTPSSRQAAVAKMWMQLEDRIGHRGLACSWAWTETWIKHYGDQVDYWFAIGRLDGAPVAAALIVRSDAERRGPFRIRNVHVGPAGEHFSETVRIEYNRLLVAPHLRRLFVHGLMAGLSAEVGKFDQVRLDGFAPEEIAPFQTTKLDLTYNRRICHVADLAEMRSAGIPVLDALRRHTAAKIRRTARRIEEVHGPLTLEMAKTAPGALEMLNDLRDLHQIRWKNAGKPGAFASPRFNHFHEDLVERLFPSGQILMARVRAGDLLLGVDYGFIERNRVLSYQWGIAQFDDRRLSAGLLVGAIVMQAALDRGLDEYDWLAGDALYKRELSTTSRELVWANASRGSRMHVLNALTNARGRAARHRPNAAPHA